MIILTPGKTTGKQVYRIVMQAIARRKKELKSDVYLRDFCEVKKLGRATIYRWRDNIETPNAIGLTKVAQTLNEWGYPAQIEV
ncbi:MAG: hypothetical protein KDA17_05845 [Candidatus Saccharibacteria bacterium]|nr:hypothetical protein [Candidatus Saccharibacteria bacterium]